MAKFIVETQVRENYGTAIRPHWKCKGGDTYVVSNFTEFNNIQPTLDCIREQVETDNDYFQEWIIDWYVAEDDYLTRDERNQLEFDGRITFPAKELVAVA